MLRQVLATVNPQANIYKHELAEAKVKIVQPLYNVETWMFKGLQETAGTININGATDECFFNYEQKEISNYHFYIIKRFMLVRDVGYPMVSLVPCLKSTRICFWILT